MTKKIILLSYLVCLFMGNNFLLAASGFIENTFPENTETLCALPGPDTVIILSTTQNSITVSWPHVTGAVRYKVTAYDLINNAYSYVTISTANHAIPAMATINGLLPGTDYEIGVSASGCAVGDFGAPTYAYSSTDNIIVGDIVIMSLCPPSFGKRFVGPSGGNASLEMLLDPNGAGDLYSQSVLVASGTASTGNWGLQLNIAGALCSNNRIKFIYQESALMSGTTIEEHQTAGQLWVKKGNTLVMMISNIAPDASGQSMRFNVSISNSNNVVTSFSSCSITALCADPCETDHCSAGGKAAGGSGGNAQLTMEDRNDGADVLSIPSEEFIAAAPNPFNDFTNIHYQITKQSPVTMTLFNAMGQVQREIFSAENEEPGYYTRPMDVSDLAPGIYFLTIQTESGRKITTVIKQ